MNDDWSENSSMPRPLTDEARIKLYWVVKIKKIIREYIKSWK